MPFVEFVDEKFQQDVQMSSEDMPDLRFDGQTMAVKNAVRCCYSGIVHAYLTMSVLRLEGQVMIIMHETRVLLFGACAVRSSE